MESKIKGILTSDGIQKILAEIYKSVNNGIPNIIPSIREMANNYLTKYHDPRKAAQQMIAFQSTKSAISGFVTGFGGLISMPITLSANITS